MHKILTKLTQVILVVALLLTSVTSAIAASLQPQAEADAVSLTLVDDQSFSRGLQPLSDHDDDEDTEDDDDDRDEEEDDDDDRDEEEDDDNDRDEEEDDDNDRDEEEDDDDRDEEDDDDDRDEEEDDDDDRDEEEDDDDDRDEEEDDDDDRDEEEDDDDDDSDDEGLKDIVDTAIEAGIFDTLVAAVQAAGLEDTLRSDGPFTVFAPTDDAFDALPDGVLDGLLADPEALANVLLYHVVPGERLLAADVVDEDSLTMAQGQNVSIRVEDGKVFINDSEIIATDVIASNGVIHVINAVLIPPDEARSVPGGASAAGQPF